VPPTTVKQDILLLLAAYKFLRPHFFFFFSNSQVFQFFKSSRSRYLVPEPSSTIISQWPPESVGRYFCCFSHTWRLHQGRSGCSSTSFLNIRRWLLAPRFLYQRSYGSRPMDAATVRRRFRTTISAAPHPHTSAALSARRWMQLARPNSRRPEDFRGGVVRHLFRPRDSLTSVMPDLTPYNASNMG
jgi:hypothetical protein